jgi:NADH-quinone oxidoreductase subunit M
VILGAAYLLWLYQRVFFGNVTNPKNEHLRDLSGREILTFAPLIIAAVWIGVYPKPFFEVLDQPVKGIVATVRPDYPLNPPAPVKAQLAPEAAKQAAGAGGSR